jgi:hypothetical protein
MSDAEDISDLLADLLASQREHLTEPAFRLYLAAYGLVVSGRHVQSVADEGQEGAAPLPASNASVERSLNALRREVDRRATREDVQEVRQLLVDAIAASQEVEVVPAGAAVIDEATTDHFREALSASAEPADEITGPVSALAAMERVRDERDA